MARKSNKNILSEINQIHPNLQLNLSSFKDVQIFLIKNMKKKNWFWKWLQFCVFEE